MSTQSHFFTSIRYTSFYKRAKGLITAGLFLTGNLVSTLPAIAAPTPSANIVVDTAPPINQRPTIDVTHNGIDQINIVHPNDVGVSHNKFNQYNVHETGQILNNSPTITDTKLAGQITGNPHLKDGKTANTIINEVTGYSPTKLLGYTEVAGKQAAVIIANPNGITCAGCGFINTSRASLATGHPNLDVNGNLQSITVGGGEVGFDGAGGNFAEVPVLDIISRKVRINAPVNGQDIRVVAGRNNYNYADGTAAPLASDGTQAPEFAIETSALGGMTGNHIQMLVNEKGAGVRVDGRMASTAGDMQLTADGRLVIAGELSAQNNLNAHVDVVENTGTIGANNGIELQGRSLTNTGKIIAKGQQNSRIAVNEALDNSGSIETQSGLQVSAQNLANHGKIGSNNGTIEIQSGRLVNNDGTIIAGADNNLGDLTLNTGDIENSRGTIQATNGSVNATIGSYTDTDKGVVYAGKELTLNASGDVYVANAIQSQGQFTLQANKLTIANSEASISSLNGNGALTIANDLINNGTISFAKGSLALDTGSFSNNGTFDIGFGGLNFNIKGDFSNKNGSLIADASDVTITAKGTIDNTNGQIGVKNQGNVTINSQNLLNQGGLIRTSTGDVLLNIATLNNQQGSILTNNGQINIQALQNIANNGGKIGVQGSGNITITAKGDIDNSTIGDQQGQIVTPSGFVQITGSNLNNNNGQIGALTNGDITLSLQQNLQNTNGKIITPLGNININSGAFTNSNGQVLTSSGDLTLRSGDLENSNGVIQATEGNIKAEIGNYTDTTNGLVYASNNLTINASGDISITNAIQGGQGLYLSAKSLILNNVNASLSSLSGNGTVTIINGLINIGNIFVDQGGLEIIAGSITNNNQISTNAGTLSITANNGDISNRSARILTKNDAITLNATGKLDNSASGQIGSQDNGNITLKTGDLNNQTGLIRTSVGDVSLDIGSLDNSANGVILTSSGNVEVNASQGINNNYGQIGAQQNGNVTITSKGDIDNRQGQIVTPSDFLKITGNTLDNSNSGKIGSNDGNVEITSGRLVNNDGTIIAGTDNNLGDLTLTSGDVENSNGTLQATNGSVNATIGSYRDTNKGVVYAGKDLTLNASGDVSIANALQSQGQFTLQANKLTIANLEASISSLNGNGSLKIVNNLINNGSIYTSLGNLEIIAASLENSGSLYGKGFVTLQIGQSLKNTGVFADNKLAGGMIQSDGDVSLTATSLENSGFIQSLQGVNLQLSGDMKNQSVGEYSGVIQSGNGQAIQLNAQNLQNDNGQIVSDAALNLTIQNILINSGYLQANTGILLTTPTLNNNGGNLLALGGDVNIGLSQPTAIDNSNGKIQANGNIILNGSSYQSSEQSYLTAQQQLQAHFSGDVVNNGQMVGGNDLTLTASSISNGSQGLIYSGKGNIDLTALGQNGLLNEGNIQGVGENSQLSIQSSNLTNQGVILSKNGAVLNVNQQFNNQRNQDIIGKIITQGGDLILNAPVVNNDGLMISPTNLTITSQNVTNTGYVSADQALVINAENSIVNNAASSGLVFNDTTLVSGSLIGGDAQLSAQTINNQNGWIQGNNGLTLTANNITNTQKGVILSTKGDVTLQGTGSTEGNILPVMSVVNNDSNIQAYNRLWVATQNLDNTNGVLSSDSGDIRLDQGSSGTALQSFSNAGGTLQSSKDLSLSFSQLDSAQGSKILAGGLLTLIIGSDFTNNGTLWGGQGLNLTLSSLINNIDSIIGADHGYVTIHAQNGNVTNYGVIKNLDNTGNLIIQTQSLMNDKGSILANSSIDLQLSQKLTNQNGGEITAYNQGNIHFTGNGFDNTGLMLAGGSITGNSSGDINNNASGYIYGSQGVTLTSNTQIANNAQGQIGSDTGILSLNAPILSFAKDGQIITSNGNIILTASSGMSNHGWLQGMGDIQITTPSFDNSEGAIVSMNGAMAIQRDQNGNGLDQINNNNGILQSGGDLTLYTNNLQNQAGKILTFAALGNETFGNISLYANAQGGSLQQLDLSNSGIIQSSKDINLNAQSGGLSSTGSLIATQTLNAVLNGDVNNNNIVFASLGATQGSGVHLTVNGDYSISEDGGITSAGDLSVKANNMINNGVLIASNDVSLNATSLTNNVKGLVSSTNNLTIMTSGNLNNFGVLQTDQGSMVINAVGDVKNTGGLIRTQSANGDITLTANSFENKYVGTLTTEKVDTTTIYNTAVNAEGQPYAGMTNKEVTETYANSGGWSSGNLGQYMYASNVKILKIDAPEGLYTQDGKAASGYFYMFLSGGAGNSNTRVEVTASGTQSVLNGNSAIISAGRDLKVITTGAITNDVSHMEAGNNMQLTGASLDNIGYQNDVVYKLACYNSDFCRYLYPKEAANNPNPIYTIDGTYDGNKNKLIMDGHSMVNPPVHIWGANTVNTGLSGSIVAGGTLIGQFAGQVNNTTIIEHALDSDFTNMNPTLPSGKKPTTTDGENGKTGLTGPGNSDLSSNGSDTNAIAGQNNDIAYSGVTNPQGIDPGLHVNLPGFNGSGSTSVDDILSSLTGGQALFRPNPNVDNGNASLNTISGGGIHNGNSATGNGGSGNITNNAINAGGSIAGNINTSSATSNSNYLIETRPQYTSVNEFYGSQYLLNHLDINGSYTFLGDAGFDTQYIQQQYIQATGQTYPGGTYMTASDAMKTLLDNAASQSDKLGLSIGTALTPEQQAALDEDIVWYVPQTVDGKEVLVPQLYLSPKTDVLAGAAIKGKDVSITGGSITNSGLMQGTNSIALTATNGDISNIGGTIKGGNISLNAQNGSVINSDTVNNYLVNGGTGSYLGSQGQIIASGTLGIQASDSITTHGGTIQSGSDLAMKAGTINIGAAELNAAASSVTHSSDGTLSFNGNQTKNYGTSIKAGGNASLQSTTGDLTLSGSTLNAGGNVSLSSAGNIGLNAVTDSGLSDVKGKKSGTFSNSSFENKYAYTNEVGSTVTSGGQLNVIAQNDVNISGGLTAKSDVNVVAKEGSITENALTSTSDSYDYHHTKKTGFFGSETGLSAQVGTKKNTKKDASSSVTHTGSNITSTEGNVNMSANKDININGSNILAKNDINMTGDNVNFNTVQDKTNSSHYQKDSFTGLTAGVSGQSVIGGVSKNALAAVNSKDNASMSTSISSAATTTTKAALGGSGALDAVADNPINLAQASAAEKANASNHAAVDYNLMGVNASVGHSSNKSESQKATTTDVGSTIQAGGKVNITAKNDINATGSNISGNDVIFNAGGDINLNAGYKTEDTKSSSSKNSFGVGASASVGIAGGSVGLTAEASLGWGNSKSSSKTAIDTVVNGTNSVVMNNKNGSLNINGAQITNQNADGTTSDGSITINTGNLNITTPQNTAKYDSDSYSGGLSGSLPLVSAGFGNSTGPLIPFTQGTLTGGITDIHNDYKSTEQTMSGLYAGKGGLDVNVSGTTTLTGGAITSAADADKNQITTGSLVANSLENKSVWSGLNVNGSATGTSQYTVAGTASDAKDNHLLPGNVLNKASGLGINGNVVMNNEHTTTDSVISGNITVNAGSTTGKIVNDADAANGYIKDNFDANKMQSDFTKQNNLTQNLTDIGNSLTDIVVSTIDKHNPEVIADWKDTGHKISTGVGAIGGAAMGGGNVGATTAGVVAGDLVNGLASDASQQLADKISPDQKNPSDPKNGGNDSSQVKDVLPNDNNKQNEQNDNNKQIYDTTTDINKVVSNITHDVIVGGFGAIAGIVFGGGNAGLDATAGGITSLKVAPKIEKPKDQKVDTKTKDKQPKPGEQNVPTK